MTVIAGKHLLYGKIPTLLISEVDMEKRYQVFVSSTFNDLQDERKEIFQTLMKMNCIPAGMEIFPAVDQGQFDYIKSIIDDSDYYLLVVGGRYGTLSPEGMSFTEQEFDYAISKGMKVTVLLHGDPNAIVVGKTDRDPALEARLQEFREKVSTGRLVKTWTDSTELPALVALNLPYTMRAYPAVGWVRASHAGSEELLVQINQLRLANEDLELRLREISPPPSSLGEIAGMDETLGVSGDYRASYTERWQQWATTTTWSRLFGAIAPHLLDEPVDALVAKKLAVALCRHTTELEHARILDGIYQTIKIQLNVLGLVNLTHDKMRVGKPLVWSLTEVGRKKMLELGAVRAKDNGSDPVT